MLCRILDFGEISPVVTMVSHKRDSMIKVSHKRDRKELQMSRINKGDLSHRMTLRLNDNQMDFLVNVSEACGVSPSEYVRMMINAGMVAMVRASESLTKDVKGGMSNENIQADKHNIV